MAELMNPHDDTAPQTLEGIIAIQAAIESDSRPIYRIYIVAKKRYERPYAELARLATRANIALEWVSAEVIEQWADGKTHGGAIAIVGQRRLVALGDLSLDAPLAMLDGIEDPYNFGQAVRSLYAAGFGGLVLGSRHWISASALIGRASAGAIERIPIAIAKTAEEASRFFAERGARVVALAQSERAIPLHSVDLTGPLFLVVGGERRGISRAVLEIAQHIIIPYGRDFPQSLGAVAAVTVAAFEVLRQRRAFDEALTLKK